MAAQEPASPAASAGEIPSLPFPLQEGETITELCRRHWIYLWPLLVFQLLIAVAPVVVIGLILDGVGELDGTVAQAFTIVAIIWVVYWVLRAVLNWYRYHNDIWVITNQRIIDSYRRHPFNLQISTADLINVQDMTVERHGILETTLDFGTIICQTASADRELRITGVADPRAVQALVDRERDRERNRLRDI